MDHPADVRLVDAHAEGNRRTHDPDVVTQEELLVGGTLLCGEAGVEAHALQALGEGDAAGTAVPDLPRAAVGVGVPAR